MNKGRYIYSILAIACIVGLIMLGYCTSDEKQVDLRNYYPEENYFMKGMILNAMEADSVKDVL